MKFSLTILLLIFLVFPGKSNNISVSNLILTGQNTTAGANNAANFTMVQFSLSWENSLRTTFGPANWDAAWVFVKYRTNGTGWQTARLHNTGHTAPSGSSIDVGLQTVGTAFNLTTNPGIGAFIYRSAIGSGTFTATNVQLRWNYGANGLADNAPVEVQVYAIEMVYIPQGAFNVGGGGGTNAFTSTTISTNVATTVPAGTGALGGMAGGYPSGQTAPIATWPNGFNAFYCMKYEISQQQYADFLNNLTPTQATARYSAASTSLRYGMTVSNGVYSSSFPFVACNFLSWADVAAYLDWSGLRPMTELEFEKTCRGTIAAVTGEYAWGSTTILGPTGVTNSGLANELAATAGSNCRYANGTVFQGPIRVGAFAQATTSRSQAGATYYGVMDMSGNLQERTVSIGDATGRAFNGSHGDGTLTTAGDANTSTWPGATAVGIGQRGGGWSSAAALLGISDRSNAATTLATRANDLSGRGVRTAP